MGREITERRVIGQLLDQVRASKDPLVKPEPIALWIPQNDLARETPLDIIRGLESRHPWPAEWETKLREISPKSTTTSWLYGAWLNKAGRWTLYEMLPYANIPEGMRVLLGGTPYWEMPKHLRSGRKQLVSAFQWEMYRRHQVWARPFWVIQGSDGGTPASYTELEEAILQAKGLPTEPPEPGALPYAPFDGRVEKQLRARDRLWKLRQRLDKLRASGENDALKAETAAAEKAFRAEFWSQMEDRMAPQSDFWAWYSKKEEADRITRPTTDAEQIAAEEAKDTYIETGALPVA